MPQVDGAVIKQRAAALRAEGDRIRQGWLESQTDTVQNVLVERADRGRTGTFAQVILSQPQALGSLVDVTITGHDGRMLTGELI
jgi:threonylcarbamoyladenosine tRNA methylthiotransferase MtaB